MIRWPLEFFIRAHTGQFTTERSTYDLLLVISNIKNSYQAKTSSTVKSGTATLTTDFGVARKT